MSYIFKGKTYSNTSTEYMIELGLSEEQIESILNQEQYEKIKFEKEATITRKKALSTLVLDGFSYDTNTEALENINRAIRIADAKNYDETQLFSWRLANNTSRETTVSELREILTMHDDKCVDIWNQFNAWLAGDKTTKFVCL